MFYFRELNDKNLFIADIPLVASGTGKNVSVLGVSRLQPADRLVRGHAGSKVCPCRSVPAARR